VSNNANHALTRREAGRGAVPASLDIGKGAHAAGLRVFASIIITCQARRGSARAHLVCWRAWRWRSVSSRKAAHIRSSACMKSCHSRPHVRVL